MVTPMARGFEGEASRAKGLGVGIALPCGVVAASREKLPKFSAVNAEMLLGVGADDAAGAVLA
jgi:hypothetical protein